MPAYQRSRSTVGNYLDRSYRVGAADRQCRSPDVVVAFVEAVLVPRTSSTYVREVAEVEVVDQLEPVDDDAAEVAVALTKVRKSA